MNQNNNDADSGSSPSNVGLGNKIAISKWIDARKNQPPDPGENSVQYLVITDTKSTEQDCKRWAGMGKPEFASFYGKGWDRQWLTNGGLEVAYWMEPPNFDMRWEMNKEGTPGEWVHNG